MAKKELYPQYLYIKTKIDNGETCFYAQPTYEDYCEREQDAVVSVYAYWGLILLRNNTIVVSDIGADLEGMAKRDARSTTFP